METPDEAQIRQQREHFKVAFEAGDIDHIMTLFHGDELVFFDIMPPMQFVGYDAFRKSWEDFLNPFNGTQTMTYADMKITCSDEVGFVRHFTRVQGTMQGQPLDIWTRETNCLRKINGTWLVVHGHVSVPSDLATGKALLNLKP